jgi:predicted PurR-regulated permease PerM
MFSIRKGKPAQVVEFTISNRSLVRIFAVTFGFLIALAAIRQASHSLVLIFTAFFLALALNAPVHWVAQRIPGRRRGNRSLATLLSVIFVLALLVGFLASIVPPFVRQIGSLVDTAPGFVNDLRNENSDIGRFIEHYNLENQVDSFSSDLSKRLEGFAGSAASTVASIGSSAFSLLTVLALTFMMLVEGPRWVKLGERLVPEPKREHTRELTRAMYRVVKGYVNGQVLLAAIASLLILPVLFILNISYPIALMVIVFICGLIPLVGHTIGAVIVTLVALFTSPVSAVIVLAYYILYQQIENYFIQPRIQANSTNMSPLLVFMAVVLGINFGGLLGGLVAIPIMGCVRILVIDQLMRRNILAQAPVPMTAAYAAAEVSSELPPTTRPAKKPKK